MSQNALRGASIFLPVAEVIRLGGGPAKLAKAISAITPDQPIKENAIRGSGLSSGTGWSQSVVSMPSLVFSTCQSRLYGRISLATGVLEDGSEQTASP